MLKRKTANMTTIPPTITADSDLLFSRRNRKGKYVQRLVLDIAHAIMPALSDADTFGNIRLRYTTESCEVISSASAKAPDLLDITPAQTAVIALLSDTMSRQIFRMTGATGFELITWSNSLPTQPVVFSLLSQDGRQTRIFNPKSSANRVFNGLVDLSDEMDAFYSSPHRKACDLDTFLDQEGSQTWISDHATQDMSGPKKLTLPKPQINRASIPAGPAIIAGLRALISTSALPEVIRLIETYEASLVRATTHRTSRWGQDDHLAIKRTARRAANLNESLTTGIKPLSRSMRDTMADQLKGLADARPLTHLAVEFGISEAAIRKRLDKLGWESPRRWKIRSGH